METRKVLGLIIAVALVEFGLSHFVIRTDHYTPDSYAYEKVLMKLAGEVDEWPHAHYTANFLYSFLTLPVYKLTGDADLSFSLVSLMFYLLLGISSWFCCKAMKIKDELSLAISLLIISHPIIIPYASLHLTDVPALALSMLCIYALFAIKNCGINGVFFGLTLLARPQYFTFFPMYFVKFDLKQIGVIFLIALAMTAAWGLVSNAPYHPVEQFVSHSEYIQEGMEKEGLQKHLTLATSLMDLFLGVVFVFYYQIFFLMSGIMQDTGQRRLVLLIILLVGILALFVNPLKVPRLFLILIAPLTVWAVFGMAKVAKKIDKRLFWIAVITLIVVNNVLTFLFFDKSLHPLPKQA